MSIRAIDIAIAAASLLVSVATPAYAQATRTWVSGVGDDANPCSRTAPCKTFAGAISKTAVNGEISVLDPGGFGAVTITKSISIIADGSEGSILGCNTSGIIINSATANVHLRGLMIEGCGNGLSGIRIIAATSVHIEKCLIRGFTSNQATNYAIDVENSAGAVKVHVSDTTISNNLRGIGVNPTAGGTASVMLNNVTVEKNSTGIRAAGNGATLWLNNSVITNNVNGLSVAGGAVANSFKNNVISGNANDVPDAPVTPINPI